MINKRYADFLPSLQSSEQLMIQVDEVSKEMEALKNCIKNEVWLDLNPTTKDRQADRSANFLFLFNFIVFAGTAKYPGGRDRVCKAKTAAGKKHCHHRSAWTSKRGTSSRKMSQKCLSLYFSE